MSIVLSMSVNFDCLTENFTDRFEFMHCLGTIKQGFHDSKYVDVDDICRFLKMIRSQLYDIIEQLNTDRDTVGLSSVLEDVFAVILLIHERTKDKNDLLQEFNDIHEILERYETGFGLKMKLQILKEVDGKCKIYYQRPVDELERAKEKRQEDRITADDYSFLRE